MTLAPRVVLVSRRTELDELLARHGTAAQAAFFLSARGRDLDEVTARAEAARAALTEVAAAIPRDWRRGSVQRADLDRFPFTPDDIVVVVGQDGLVANVAKYLDGQPVLGVDPEPGRNSGVLVPHRPAAVAALLESLASGRAQLRRRTMVSAETDDGQVLHALNELYVGHPTHQSARYRLAVDGAVPERQSSSGVIVSTGTGATGWCASIVRTTASRVSMPAPEEPALAWFVREAWPSPATGVERTEGRLEDSDALRVMSETDGLVVFGDGVEADRLVLAWGQSVALRVSPRRLCLVPE
ncbi:MAG TPA: hypothetical protein VM287_10425 [Egibacteraceae bacterium]|nr:hypothetical protein [Egibacteraceae bacterium]